MIFADLQCMQRHPIKTIVLAVPKGSLRDSIKIQLQLAGYEIVAECEAGQAGVMLELHEPDLIIVQDLHFMFSTAGKTQIVTDWTDRTFVSVTRDMEWW
jgi:hypothetical protein